MKKSRTSHATEKVIPYRQFKTKRYPNSADRSYYKALVVDLALTAVTCIGAVSALGFLITL